MKIIYINGRYLSQSITGVQRYAIELIKSIDKCLDQNIDNSIPLSFILLVPKNAKQLPVFKHITIKKVGRFSGQLWEQLELPIYARDQLLLNLCNTAPLFYSNQIVVIHDAAVFAAPKGYSKTFIAWYRFLMPKVCRNSRKVVTVSEFSKSELVNYCDADPDRILVAPNGVDHIDRIESNPHTLYKFGLSGRQFVLGVASLNPNKNLGMFFEIAEAFADKNIEFVVAGGDNARVFAQTSMKNDKVRFLGYVMDDELKTLYENAACFVFPSFYEGFGIPPLEALRCGCPVVSSNAASLPDVCGDAALFASPNSPEDFILQVKRVLDSDLLRCEMIEKGKLRSNCFKWEDIAYKFIYLIPTLK